VLVKEGKYISPNTESKEFRRIYASICSRNERGLSQSSLTSLESLNARKEKLLQKIAETKQKLA